MSHKTHWHWLWGVLVLPFVFSPVGDGMAVDLKAQTRQAITKAVDFLTQAQQPEGSFRMYECHDEALTECNTPYSSRASRMLTPHSPVEGSPPTALVLRGLLAVAAEDPRAAVLVERGARWLKAQMDAEGLFGLFRMVSPAMGPECVGEFRSLFATPLNRSVLDPLDDSLPPILPRLATYQTSDGVFFPFAIPAAEVMAITAGGPARERFYERYTPLMRFHGLSVLKRLDLVDPLLNAMVFRYLVQHGHAPAALCDYLLEAAEQTHLPADPVTLEHPEWFHASIQSPHQFWYEVSWAYAHGAACLEPAMTALQPRLLAQQQPNGSWGSVIDTALATSSLMQLGYTGNALDRAMRFLLDQQQADGSWRRVAWSPNAWWVKWHASEELSTGYVLEALGTYLKAAQPTTL